MKLYTPVFAEVTGILTKLSRDKTKSQTHEYKHPSGIIEVSITPPNEQDETTQYNVSMTLWGVHSLYMSCDSVAAASALVASIMCMDGESVEAAKCVYYEDCQGQGEHQCPKCKKWYCGECREMWLPIDPKFWVQTAMMCPQCHYNVYGRQ